MQWYYSKNGTQLGPIGDEEIKAKVASGEIAPTDLVWKDGMGDWLPSSQVAELRGNAPTQTATPGADSPHSPYQAPATVGSPAYQSPQGVVVLSQGMSIASMVCGILGLVTCCLWCLSGPLAIVAVVLGHISLSKINAEPMKFGGKGMAKAGLITGYAALVLTLLLLIITMVAPDRIQQMDFLPQEVREEILRKQQEQNQLRPPSQ
jgi:hypothetical protein